VPGIAWTFQHQNLTDGGGALNTGNVYLRNGGDYITSKLAMLVVGLVLTVSDGCFLEEV
jgi:hypothetical protein